MSYASSSTISFVLRKDFAAPREADTPARLLYKQISKDGEQLGNDIPNAGIEFVHDIVVLVRLGELDVRECRDVLPVDIDESVAREVAHLVVGLPVVLDRSIQLDEECE